MAERRARATDRAMRAARQLRTALWRYRALGNWRRFITVGRWRLCGRLLRWLVWARAICYIKRSGVVGGEGLERYWNASWLWRWCGEVELRRVVVEGLEAGGRTAGKLEGGGAAGDLSTAGGPRRRRARLPAAAWQTSRKQSQYVVRCGITCDPAIEYLCRYGVIMAL